METEKFNCPNCDNEILFKLNEFVDVSAEPNYKEKILDGSFFTVKCHECGDETFIEYPVMYMDPVKKLNIYMSPEHDGELLNQLNSLTVPESDIDEDAVFRLVKGYNELLEKIVIYDRGRDDRVLQLYKVILCEDIKKDYPEATPSDLLYDYDGDSEYFVFWGHYDPKQGSLTSDLDEDIYRRLEEDYSGLLNTPPNQYQEIDEMWLLERIEVEQ